jgi:hypothetical protein
VVSAAAREPLACPKCARRYPLDERFCKECGMPLTYAGSVGAEATVSPQQEKARKIKPEYSRGELRRVVTARHQVEAEFIQMLLLEEGVPSTLRRTAGFDVPDFLAAGPRDVLVAESGLGVAREILLESEITQEPEAPVRRDPSSPALPHWRGVVWALSLLAAAGVIVWVAAGAPH